MKRVYYGAIPSGYNFFQNLLFDMVEQDGYGLKQYADNEGQPNGQGFKITIIIERDEKWPNAAQNNRPKTSLFSALNG